MKKLFFLLSFVTLAFTSAFAGNKKVLRPALLSRKNAENTDEIKEEVVSYNVYTIMGNRLASFTQYEALHSFIQTYNGIALVQVLHGDNSVEVIKLTK